MFLPTTTMTPGIFVITSGRANLKCQKPVREQI